MNTWDPGLAGRWLMGGKRVIGMTAADFVVVGLFMLINTVGPRFTNFVQTLGFTDQFSMAATTTFIEVLKHVIFQQYSVSS
jgi:hypothetical protein